MVKKILLPSAVATSLMTLFSYLIAEKENKNFSEPELLATIEKKKLPASLKQLALPGGWLTHYSVGVLMALFFDVTWQQFNIKSTLNRSIVAGTLGGLVAIGSWRLLFTSLPRHSKNYYKKFYAQLFIAHIVFALAQTATQKQTK